MPLMASPQTFDEMELEDDTEYFTARDPRDSPQTDYGYNAFEDADEHSSYFGQAQPQDAYNVPSVPERYRSMFGFPLFNAIQSSCWDTVMHSDRNLVVSAPTGSGKTVIMELAIIHLLMQPDMSTSHSGATSFKSVYLAPTKALCSERAADWGRKFQPLGIHVGELTGDTEYANVSSVKASHIIITTPEKWDSMTRRWRDHRQLIGSLRLFLVDEVHMLNEKRGATLEVIVSRMKTVDKELSPGISKIRYLALSATIPNVQDVAAWLSDATHVPADIKVFGEEYRPVRLQRHVLGFDNKSNNQWQFDRALNHQLLDVINTYSEKKPSLVFCSTRKGAEQCAAFLKDQCPDPAARGHPFIKDAVHAQRLNAACLQVQDRKLQDLIRHGVAYHNAGLEWADRRKVEELFLQGTVTVICTTSTLAVGVNLPAHLVVIKSTMTYANGASKEYSELDIAQMLGRAGRPQFDHTGKAVIMTDRRTQAKYEGLISGNETVESSLHENLIEHLNAEVVLGTVSSFRTALLWLKSTFLYIRIRKNPSHYRVLGEAGIGNRITAPDKKLELLCVQGLKQLQEHGMIEIASSGNAVQPTALGTTMAKYYVKLQTVVNMTRLKQHPGLEEMLRCLSQAEEFSSTRYHAGEKGTLNELNKSELIRFPLKGKVKDLEDKIFLLLQVVLGSVQPSNDKLRPIIANETGLIWQHITRISQCLIELATQRQDAVELRHAINLHCAYRLTSVLGISSFETLLSSDPRRIEMAVNRNPPFGNTVLEAAAKFPQLSMQIECRAAGAFAVHISLLNPTTCLMHGRHGMRHVLFLAETSSHQLVDYRRIPLHQVKAKHSFSLAAAGGSLTCSLLPDDAVGLDVHCQVVVEGSEGCQGTVPRSVHAAAARISDGPFATPVDTDDQSSCNHRCRDKSSCAHQCCKTGRKHAPRPPSRKPSSEPQHPYASAPNTSTMFTNHSPIAGVQHNYHDADVDDYVQGDDFDDYDAQYDFGDVDNLATFKPLSPAAVDDFDSTYFAVSPPREHPPAGSPALPAQQPSEVISLLDDDSFVLSADSASSSSSSDLGPLVPAATKTDSTVLQSSLETHQPNATFNDARLGMLRLLERCKKTILEQHRASSG
ncbi:ATP-dependent DNA helicase MER3 [Sorochytrium milnesiophthora]